MQFHALGRLTEWLDDRLRFWDLRARRTAGGRLDRWLGIPRHTLSALVLPSLICGLLVTGIPAPTRLALGAATAIATCAVLAIAMRRTSRANRPIRQDLLIQIAIVLAVSAVIWFLGPDQYRESGVYRHVFVPLTAALSAALLAAATLSHAMFKPLREHSNYGDALARTELFIWRGKSPAVTPWTIATAALVALFRSPLALLTLPAIVALVARPLWLIPATLATAAVCFLALFIAGLNERFAFMWTLMQSVFFTKGSALVSILVIALAAARLKGVSYVTTVLDTAAWHTIGAGLAAAYLLSWWYDYWTSRLLANEVLGLLNPDCEGQVSIPYPIEPERAVKSVPADGRTLQIHGASRIIALHDGTGTTFFQSYPLGDLINTLAIAGKPGGRAIPAPATVLGRLMNVHTIVAVVFAAIAALGMWRLHKGPQYEEARLNPSTAPGLTLDALLLRPPGETLYVVAASGGGTRAAIYTAAVLEGIARRGKIGNVILGSGVSGGGASLAYFGAHRPQLVTGDAAAWQAYFDAMAEPYIQDVLERAAEWRMISGGRMGTLLAESFQRRWRLPEGRRHLDQIRDIGLIFNTALAGHYERTGNGPDLPPLRVAADPRETKSTLAGGRLLLTNLDFPSALASAPLEPGTKRPLPVVLRGPELRVEEAAALNANFPPVFPNAAIDVGNQVRYWVTDGGAVDNRGMEMLLYALRLALEKKSGDALPRLHVVVADASALSESFAQDRGVSSMTGAGSHFASHLNAELVAGIRKQYAAHPDRFAFSYVMMPDRLRESGSFGTHWMLQPEIDVRSAGDHVTLSGSEMVAVLRALHSGDTQSLTPAACKVLLWSREDQGHRQGWAQVLDSLGAGGPAPACSPN